MKIKIKKYELVEQEVEIEFPFYGHTFDMLDRAPVSWDTYVRIEEDGSHATLNIKDDDGDKSFEFTVHGKDMQSALSNYGKFDRVTADEFAAAIGRAQEALKRYG